ncbi:Beta-galactosidase precursor [Paraliobacillus sp. PM-2]|uniref:glycoside hydrolase family 35 protein n=1 Tax=Paraliobacillus sp. PM-2 TaxID=1462524 RepID=UPI00061BD376|nr:beta-galactosidase family protein [Paraliobacillus sp. PM-2]CQR47176.1 Beta-galactosidase precursor [Paraliobacillus sp. PM-2]
MSKLEVRGKYLYLNGEAIQLISGAIHYFRIVPEYWEDRLLKLKACGFNCVETYIPWNLHEPKEGEYNFEGLSDVEAFIKTADRLGLYVIVRPSPYICAEWEFGGLPSWLLADRNMKVRSYYEPYLEKIDNYYNVLLERLKPLQSTHGGPIIAMQIENEYGSFGNDKQYLTYLKESMEKRGIDVLLFTSDGPSDLLLQGGTLDGVLATINFGSRPVKAFDLLQKHYPNTPNICMEFWNGWFDHWGEKHHTRDPQDAADTFAHMLGNGDSVNFYMFHGGTNFSFYNGANHGEKYEPTITSYDYDCPISETGDITPKFYAIREAIAKHKDIGELVLPDPIPKINYGLVEMKESTNLFDALPDISSSVRKANPESMEEMGQDYGFILYRTILKGPKEKGPLAIQEVRDRALVFVDQKFHSVIDRWQNNTIEIEVPEKGAQLDILVENMGRINYGPKLKDMKGITEGVRFASQFQYDWEIFCLPMDNLEKLNYQTNVKGISSTPTFYRGSIQIDEIGDTFVELAGWKKGFVLVNGFNIGRYWEIGPQKTLYLPGPLLKQGENEIVIFELQKPDNQVISLIDEHKLE